MLKLDVMEMSDLLQVYNLGDYRRKIQPKYAGNDIFSPDNKEGNALRERVCNEGLADLLHWLEHEDGEVH